MPRAMNGLSGAEFQWSKMGLEDYIGQFTIKPNVTWDKIQYRHFYKMGPKSVHYLGLKDEDEEQYWSGTPPY